MYDMKHSIFIIIPILCCLVSFNKAIAQSVDPEKLLGVWKLEKSGFIDNAEVVIKQFNDCRLSQNFVFKSDGTVDHTYYEGDLDTCYIGKTESYKWHILEDTLVLSSGEYFGYYVLQMINNGSFRMQAVQTEIESTGDEILDKMLNTVHFDVYTKHNGPVSCDQCKLILKLN